MTCLLPQTETIAGQDDVGSICTVSLAGDSVIQSDENVPTLLTTFCHSLTGSCSHRLNMGGVSSYTALPRRTSALQ